MSNRGDFGGGGGQSYGSNGSTTAASYHGPTSTKDSNKFNSLCDTASSKIFLLNKNVSKLEILSKSIDTSANEKTAETQIHTLSQDSNKLATETKNIFKEILEYTRAGRNDVFDNRQGRFSLQQNKLRKEFENTLSRYHAIQNVLSLKMKANIAQETHTPDEPEPKLIDDGFDDDKQLVVQDQLSIGQFQVIQQECYTENQQVQMESEVAEAKEREARLMQIEEDMLNVNDIFRDLAFLVHEQGQAVDSIESNIEHAAVHVSEGNQQLQRAKTYQKSARRRMCIIALICVVVATVLVLIIYYSSN